MDESRLSGRRGFLKAGCGVVGEVVLSSAPAIISAQSVTKAIRIGLVGCGGRGTGAASQALIADPHAELTAVADVDHRQAERAVDTLRKINKISNQVKVDSSRRFIGLDGFRRVIESDVDLVLLATPPAFRPMHLAACVDAGKHIFCEKPVATDPAGVRSVMQSAERAKAKNLSIMGGLCLRYNAVTQDMFKALSEGAIGKITSYQSTYFGNTVKPMQPVSVRSSGMSDTEWQIRNWYNFVWLSGDGLVEQAIHNVDRIAWAMHDAPPLYCIASGGRSVPAPDGNIFDHFSVEYYYPNGVEAQLNTRQIDGCYNGIFDLVTGTEGTCTFGRGPYPVFQTKNKLDLGNQMRSVVDYITEHTGSFGARLRTHVEVDMYQAEQNVLMESLRNHKRIDDGYRMATSTLLAIMGRTAAYTGQQITWDQILHSDERLVPEHIDWNGKLAVAPRAQPGMTKLS